MNDIPTPHQRRLLEVAESIASLVHYYMKVEKMSLTQAVRFAFERVEDLREDILADATSDE